MTLKRSVLVLAAALLVAAGSADVARACEGKKTEAAATQASAPADAGAVKAKAQTADLKAHDADCAKAKAQTADLKADGTGCAGAKAAGKGCCSKAKAAALTAEARPAEAPEAPAK